MCRKLTFPHLFYSIFYSENTNMHCHLVPNMLEIQSRTRLTFTQSQHSKRLLFVIAHRDTIKYSPFDLQAFNIKSKIALVLKISCNLLNLNLKSLQFALTFSLIFRIEYIKKALAIKECKIFIYLWFFHIAVVILSEIHIHPISWHIKVPSHSISYPGPTLNTNL